MAKPGLTIRISHAGEIALGPGKVALLQAIQAQGSISAAAKQLGMSYRRAWELVDVMNRSFDLAVVDRSTGGSHGGGAQVTPFGLELLHHYLQLLDKATVAAQTELAFIHQHLKQTLP